jgi:hypothetical protein
MNPAPYALLQYLSRAQKTDRFTMVTGVVSCSWIIGIICHSPVEVISRRGRLVADFIADTIVWCAMIIEGYNKKQA